LGKLTLLEELTLEHCSMEYFPDTFSRLRALKKLHISECHALLGLPIAMSFFTSLEEICIDNCRGMVALPEDLGTSLVREPSGLTNLPTLQELPLSLCRAGKLRHMEVSGCGSLEPSPELHLPSSLSEESRQSLS